MTETHGTYLPQYATTAKRGAARKAKKEPATLLAYAIECGPCIDVTNAETIAELTARGVPKHRIPNAVSDLKKYFGVPVTAARVGRTVISYTLTLA